MQGRLLTLELCPLTDDTIPRADLPGSPSNPMTRTPDFVPTTGKEFLRILYATPRYLPFVGGVETHTREVARRISELGHTVAVVTADPSGTLPTLERDGKVQIMRQPAWPRGGDFYVAPGFYTSIVNGQWDIVHCQGVHTFVPPLAIVAARRAGVPSILTFHTGGHSSHLRNAVREAQWRALGPLLRRVDRLVAVSRFEASLFAQQLRIPRERIAVIPNGSSLPRVDARTNRNDTLLVSIGRLERYKGHQRLIAALPEILKRAPSARVRIAGSGPYERELRRLAGELGVADRVDIRAVDGADRTQMAQLVAEASLVTLLSEYEAHPIAVVETLSLGKPVLVNYTSGLAELADDGLVRSVSPSATPVEVADAVVRNVRDPLRVPALDLPTWDACVAALMGVYRSVQRERTCAS
jgi:glycosyltransferase involved in cell wall biosynthesis